jgi:hypothetical protein
MPTPVTITGARGTGNVQQANRRPDIKSRIMDLQPEDTPLVVLLDKLPSRVTGNPEFSWFEQDLEPRFDTTSATATNVATTVNVNNGSYFAQHDLVYVPRTGETFRVVSIATNALTVVRGVGQGGTGQAINSGEELLITGSAQPEGDTSKPARSGIAAKVTNYTQIFRESVELTGTWLASDTFTSPDDWARQVRLKAIEHRREIEYALFVNHPSEDLTGSQPRRTTGGLRHFITTNVTDAGGTFTEAEFWAALRPAFRYGGRRKVLFGASLPIAVINQFAMNKVQVQQSANVNTYGLNITQFQSPFGNLNVVVDYNLEGTTLGGEMFLVDMDSLEYRYMQGRDTHFRDNIQAPDADTRKGEYLTECGVVVANEQKHARVTNITG